MEKQTTYVVSNCFSAWPNKRNVAKQLFLQTNDVKAYGQIDFRVLDIPNLHNMDYPVGEDFIAQLCNKNDPTLFLKYSVSGIIQERFQRSQKYFMIYQFWPFAIYLLLFNIWLHVIYVNDSEALRNPFVKPVSEESLEGARLRSLSYTDYGLVDIGFVNHTRSLQGTELGDTVIDVATNEPLEADPASTDSTTTPAVEGTGEEASSSEETKAADPDAGTSEAETDPATTDSTTAPN